MEVLKKIGTGIITIIGVALIILWRIKENPWGLKGVIIGAAVSIVVLIIAVIVSWIRDR